MIKIVPDKEGKLTQWDLNRKVIVTGYEGVAEVHFASPGDDHGAYVVELIDGQAKIPNILLTMAGTINVYVYPADRTVFATALWVMAREKPDDYIYTETEVLSYKTLDEKIGDLAKLTTTAKENLVAAINEAAQSGSGTDISLGVTGASVGDIIKVKAVDDSGKPTEWEAADIIDENLTAAGKAADAAAVGERLSQLSEEIANIPTGGTPVSDLKSILTDIVTFMKAVPFDDTVVSASDLDAIQTQINALSGSGSTGEPISISYDGTTATISGLASVNVAYSGTTATIGG